MRSKLSTKLMTLLLIVIFLFTQTGLTAFAAEDSSTSKVVNGNELPKDYVDNSNEGLYKILKSASSTKSMSVSSLAATPDTKVDIVFVVDSTGSMSTSITGVKNNIANFAQYLGGKGITLRLGLIDYRDITCDGSDSTVVHKAKFSPWMNVTEFISALTTVSANGGGDEAETPLDGLGYLVDGSTMLWSTDANKFAVLITDASYKTNNNRGLSGMPDLITKLTAKEIQTSVITAPYCYSKYGDLAGLTGGITANLYENFSSILSDYADSVLETTGPLSTYKVKVTDSTTGLPVTDAVISYNGQSSTTQSNGIAALSSKSDKFKSVSISKSGYTTKSYSTLTLLKDTINPIELDAVDDPDYGTDFLNKGMFINPPSGNSKLSNPSINFLGREFPLFNMPIDFNFKAFDAMKIEIKQNKEDKKYEVIIGSTYPKDRKEDNSYWKKDYDVLKNIVKGFGGDVSTTKLWNDFSKFRGMSKKVQKFGFPVPGYVGGYAEFSYASGELELTDGGIVVCCETKDLTPYAKYPLPPAPYVFVKFDFKMSATGKLSLTMGDGGKVGFFGPATLSFAAIPALSLNIGVPSVAYAGGGIEGKINTKFTLPFYSLESCFKATLEAQLFLQFRLLGFEAKPKFAPWHGVQIYPSYSSLSSLMASDTPSVKLSDFKLTSRDYLDAGGVKSFALKPSEFIFSKDNVYPYGTPQLVPLDDGKMLLVWVDDDINRSLADKTALMYSVYDGANWGEISQVDNDGTADFNPSLYNNNGKVYLAWQNCRTSLNDEATLEDMMNAVDVSYASFNGKGFEGITSVSDAEDKNYKMAPKVSADGDKISVVWMENSENNPFMLSGTNSIIRKNCEKGEWGHQEVLKTGLSMISNYTTDYINGTNSIAYSTDLDGDTATEGCSLYVIRGSDCIKVNEYASGINGLQFLNDDLYWSSDDGVSMISKAAYSDIKHLNDFSFADFTVLANNNEKAILTLKPDGVRNELYATYYNGIDWCNPIRITDYSSSLAGLSGFLAEDGSICLAFDRTKIFEKPEVPEGTYGLTDLLVAKYVKTCDLVVANEACYLAEDVIPGANLPLSVTVTNNGAKESPKLSALLYDESGKQIGNEVALDTTIAAGETKELEVPYLLPSPLKQHVIRIEILASDKTNIGTSNKTAIATIGNTDLSVDSGSIKRTDTGAQVTSTISNIGYADGSNVVVALYEKGISGKKIAEKSLDTVLVGQSKDISFDIPAEYLNTASEYDYKLFHIEASTESSDLILSNNGLDVLLQPIGVESVTLEKDELTLNVGGTCSLGYTIYPLNAADKSVIWSSSNLDVLKVDESGLITALKIGEAKITAISVNGSKIATCAVKISGESNSVQSVHINDSDVTVPVGETKTITATITPDSATNKNVQWFSGDSAIAKVETVDNKGLITGVKSGKVNISVVTNDGGYSDSIEITVVDGVHSLILNSDTGGKVKTVTDSVYASGEVINIEAVPDSGYIFKNWTSTNGGSFADANSAVTTFTMPGNATTVTAHFEALIQKYPLTLTATEGGKVSTVSKAVYASGEVINIEAIPNSGYRFKNWTSTDGGSFADANSAVTTFTMPGNATTVTACFEPIIQKYALTINAGPGGKVRTVIEAVYKIGDLINIAAIPNSGYRFDSWTSSNGGKFVDANNAETIFIMPGNAVTLTANFTHKKHGGSSVGGGILAFDWETVKNKIASAKAGEIIVVDMKSETTVPATVLEKLKGKDEKLVLNLDGYSWTINGVDIKSLPQDKTGFNLKVTKISDSNISALAEKKDIIQLELAYNGTLPFAATLAIKAGTQYSGKNVFAYFYNEKVKKLEFRIASMVDKNGIATMGLSQASKYAFISEVLAGTLIMNKISGKDVNTFVPFYLENGKQIIVPVSSAANDSIVFIAPKTAVYDYKDNVMSFGDINGHWAKDSISFVTARELFSGIGDGKFDPDSTMTRGMLVTVLGRLYGVDLSAYKDKKVFSDVDINSWYGPYVAWATEKGIVSGVGDNKFAPDEAITREEMAAIIVNYAKFIGITLPDKGSEMVFADKDKIAAWANNAVKLIQKAGIINGKPGEIYDPKGTATRAEVCAVLKRLIESVLAK